MYVVLVHQKCVRALSGEGALLESMYVVGKAKVMETPCNLLILHLSDSVLRQVDEENTFAKIWLKLKSLNMIESLTNKIYLKKQFVSF